MRITRISNYRQFNKFKIQDNHKNKSQNITFKGPSPHKTSPAMEYLHNRGKVQAQAIEPKEDLSSTIIINNNKKAESKTGNNIILENSNADKVIAKNFVSLQSSSANLINSQYAGLNNSKATVINANQIFLENSTVESIEADELVALKNSVVNGEIGVTADNDTPRVIIGDKSKVKGGITIASSQQNPTITISPNSEITGKIIFLNERGKIFLIHDNDGNIANIEGKVINGHIYNIKANSKLVKVIASINFPTPKTIPKSESNRFSTVITNILEAVNNFISP